jgi:predicted metalloprotease with PDZ domain
MDVLTDNEVRFLAGKIAESPQQGMSRQAIIADVAEVCGLEWAEAFQEEVEQEMRDYPSGPRGRRTLRQRVRQRMRPAWVGLAFGAVALLVAFPLAGDTRIAVMSGGAVVLAVGVGGLVVAAWQLRSLA